MRVRRGTDKVLVHKLSQQRCDDNRWDGWGLVDDDIEDIDHEQLNLLGHIVAYYLEKVLEELFNELVGFGEATDERGGLHGR